MRACLAPFLAFAAVLCPAGAQQQLSADAIMARLAANQDTAEAARTHFVYTQHATVSSRKGHTVQCEEVTDTRIVPSASGSEQQPLTLAGRLLQHGKYVTYTTLAKPESASKDDQSISIQAGSGSEDAGDTDRDLVENVRRSLLSTKSKDGIATHLFPLTSQNQARMAFTLLKREPMNGRQTFHIRFAPRTNDDYDWKGDAWIDADAFEPVVIRTQLSKGVPMAIKMLLGTNVPGLGFTVTYAPQPDGTWFPSTFGTEFKIHVLFFFRRQIVLSAANRDFEKTHTGARILDEAVAH